MLTPTTVTARAHLVDERGGVAVLVAVLVPGLLFLFLLVVDVGNWFVHHKHLQLQVDAAALAGGAHFGDCFSPDPATASAANATIKNAAIVYAGEGASTYNHQVGGGAPRVRTLFNSQTFFRGSYVDPDVEVGEPCQTPGLMLDVKQTEIDVPYVLGGLIDAFHPGSTTVVPAINARARVQLKKATIVQGSLPLAVPDVDPKFVTATFVNESSGGTIATVSLTKGASADGLNYWQGTGGVAVPPDTRVGVRIGLGGQSGTCPTGSTGGTGYVCYDFGNTAIGLVSVHGTGSGGTEDAPKPHVWATTSCTGTPFFAPENVAAPATTCSASVQAVLETAVGPVDPGKKQLLDAILNGGGLNKVKAPLTYDATAGYWTTGYAFAVPVDSGSVDVSLEWQSTNAGAKKQTYANVQRVYSGSDGSGPVKALSLGSATASTGSPYALAAGTHTLTVTVGVEGSLDLTNIEETVMLRLTGGSRTSAVRCDGSGAKEFHDAIVYGCTTPYQLNTVGYCPNPNPPPGPADCVPTEPGGDVGPTQQALNDRFTACPPNNWPDFDVESDPRVVKLMITDFSALGGSGHTEVPVTNFAGFYITGWTGSHCGTPPNEPPPFEVKKGAIWGHFIKYIAPDPFSDGTETCDPLAVTPCIPVLVK